jgi:hypothetical protein
VYNTKLILCTTRFDAGILTYGYVRALLFFITDYKDIGSHMKKRAALVGRACPCGIMNLDSLARRNWRLETRLFSESSSSNVNTSCYRGTALLLSIEDRDIKRIGRCEAIRGMRS